MRKKDLTDTSVQPYMLIDAKFAKASENSEFDIWVLTNDGVNRGMKAEDAIQMSNLGGKGPDRFRNWIAKEWFFKAFGEDFIERQTRNLERRQRAKQDSIRG